jgi:hypothetical protein
MNQGWAINPARHAMRNAEPPAGNQVRNARSIHPKKPESGVDCPWRRCLASMAGIPLTYYVPSGNGRTEKENQINGGNIFKRLAVIDLDQLNMV